MFWIKRPQSTFKISLRWKRVLSNKWDAVPTSRILSLSVSCNFFHGNYRNNPELQTRHDAFPTPAYKPYIKHFLLSPVLDKRPSAERSLYLSSHEHLDTRWQSPSLAPQPPPSEQLGPVSYRRGKGPWDFQGWVLNMGCEEAQASSPSWAIA